MRLYQDGEWYDAVPPGAMYEHEFESVVLDRCSDLFPGFYGARFDPLMHTPLGRVQPDMILIDEGYRSVHVVEIELSTHSLTRHVRPQMEKITQAKLTAQHADWLAKRQPPLDEVRLRSLFREVPHATTLIVNSTTPHWDGDLVAMPYVRRAVVEVYRSRHNRTILRLNGTQPEAPGTSVSPLEPGKGAFRTAFRLSIPSALPEDLGALDVEIGGELSRFNLKSLGLDRYLFSQPAVEVPNYSSHLFRDPTGRFRIEVFK